MKSEILEMKSPSLQILFWLAITFLPTITVDAEDATRLDQDHLLQYRDTNGNVQPVRTKTDWEIRRASIVKGMTTIMGKLPGDNRRAPLAIQQLEEHDAGTYIRRLITYQSEPAPDQRRRGTSGSPGDRWPNRSGLRGRTGPSRLCDLVAILPADG